MAHGACADATLEPGSIDADDRSSAFPRLIAKAGARPRRPRGRDADRRGIPTTPNKSPSVSRDLPILRCRPAV